jgi:hypothetical protein
MNMPDMGKHGRRPQNHKSSLCQAAESAHIERNPPPKKERKKRISVVVEGRRRRSY